MPIPRRTISATDYRRRKTARTGRTAPCSKWNICRTKLTPSWRNAQDRWAPRLPRAADRTPLPFARRRCTRRRPEIATTEQRKGRTASASERRIRARYGTFVFFSRWLYFVYLCRSLFLAKFWGFKKFWKRRHNAFTTFHWWKICKLIQAKNVYAIQKCRLLPRSTKSEFWGNKSGTVIHKKRTLLLL